ncbi:J domain-containing protein [Desulfobulbus alkaliphilus]|uniref:J domain-containing protein n=1 Tax=Desulfobulbus alkaliphilus TaxID=869814 RepID=UPI0019637741|nr:J domain-containing protein [Desulfobulbus alkaliphilus]MBM9537384.1 DnaJ domain-containing protein [Desulfobulbus alkaliphilus]
MITDRDRDQIAWLIKRRAEGIPTEELFILIAEHKDVLDACRQLIEQTGGDARNIPQWLTSGCRAAHIDTREFFSEINEAVVLFTPARPSETGHHAVLGLQPGADRETIKQRYRQLCRRYHPDATGDASGRDTDTFISITNAYQALMHSAEHTTELPQPPATRPRHWRRTGKTAKNKQKQGNILLFGLLAMVLVVTSLMVARAYNTKMMMSGLQNKNTAFVPPPKEQAPPNNHRQQLSTEPREYTRVPAIQTTRPQPGADPPEHHPARSSQSAPMAQNSDQQSAVALSTVQPSQPPPDLALPAPERQIPPPAAQTNVVTSQDPQQNDQKQQPTTTLSLPKQKIIPAETTKTRVAGTTSRDQHFAEADSRQPGATAPDGSTTQHRATTASPPATAVHTAKNQKTEPGKQTTSPAVTASLAASEQPSATLSQPPPELPAVPTEPLPYTIAADPPDPAAAPDSNVFMAAQKRRTQQQIDTFLRQYSTAYQQKNLTSFRSFFSPDATENGKPLQEIIPVYTQLFAQTRTLHFHVDPRYWEQHNSTIDLHGRFTINLTYLNGTKIEGQGDIRFLLIEDGEQFLIQSLNYVFDQ